MVSSAFRPKSRCHQDSACWLSYLGPPSQASLPQLHIAASVIWSLRQCEHVGKALVANATAMACNVADLWLAETSAVALGSLHGCQGLTCTYSSCIGCFLSPSPDATPYRRCGGVRLKCCSQGEPSQRRVLHGPRVGVAAPDEFKREIFWSNTSCGSQVLGQPWSGVLLSPWWWWGGSGFVAECGAKHQPEQCSCSERSPAQRTPFSVTPGRCRTALKV